MLESWTMGHRSSVENRLPIARASLSFSVSLSQQSFNPKCCKTFLRDSFGFDFGVLAAAVRCILFGRPVWSCLCLFLSMVAPLLRQDLCAATGTEFMETIASDNNRQVQSLLKTHYECPLVHDSQGQRRPVKILGG